MAVATAGPAAAQFRVRDDWHHVDRRGRRLAPRPAVRPRRPPARRLRRAREHHDGAELAAADRRARRRPCERLQPRRFQPGLQGRPRDRARAPGRPDGPPHRGQPRPVHDALPARSDSARGMRGAVYDSHRFHDGQQLTDAAKRVLVARWLREKYPLFKDRYEGNARVLRDADRSLPGAGVPSGAGRAPDRPARRPRTRSMRPRDRYHAGCRAAARPAGVPYEDFVGRIGLVSHDFVDFSHLVESGRVKYQRRLSRLVVTRLEQYGLTQ